MSLNTTAQEVFDYFDSSFRDKVYIYDDLKLIWLKRAIGRYALELDELVFDERAEEFNRKLNQYEIDTLAVFMRQFYQEREVSKINKQISIVGKDLSIDGNGNGKVAARNELEYFNARSKELVDKQKPTAFL